MKKIVILSALILAVSLTAVSCSKKGDTPETTGTQADTAEVTTETDTTGQPETKPETDPETKPETDPETKPETDPETDPETEPETDPETEPETEAPSRFTDKSDPKAGFVGWSFDTVKLGNRILNGETDGGFEDKLNALDNRIPLKLGDSQTLTFYGWIGFDQAIDSFGYDMDGEEVLNKDFLASTEDAVRLAGGEYASRFEIVVQMNDLGAGDHVLTLLAKLENGMLVQLRAEITVNVERPYTHIGGEEEVRHVSFDFVHFQKDGQELGTGAFTDGQSAGWDYIVTGSDEFNALHIGGWIAFVTDESYRFGYLLDGETLVMNDDFAVEADPAVVEAAQGLGASAASRIGIIIDTSDLYGTHTVIPVVYHMGIYTQFIGEITLNMPEKKADPGADLVNTVFDADRLLNESTQHNGLEMAIQKQDGVRYVHHTPTTSDPFYTLSDFRAGQYLGVRYRTSTAENCNIQFYIGSTGGGPSDDTSMIQKPVTADGEWHFLVIDLQSVMDTGLYDGVTASYLRFDVLETSYVLDENGNRPEGSTEKNPMPADASIDVEYLIFCDSEENAYQYDEVHYPAEVAPEPENS